MIVAWGSSYLFIRLAITTWTPFGLVATRFGIAAVLCALIGRARGDAFPKGSAVLRFALVGVMMMSGSNALTAFAQRTVASGITGTVHALGSVWLAALGTLGWWGPTRTPARAWWGVAGGLCGVALLLWPDASGAHADVFGVSLLLIATILFAIASLIQKRTQSSEVGLFAQLSVQMGAGAAMSTLLAGATGIGFTHAPVTAVSLGSVTFLTLVSSIAGFAGYAIVLRDWPPERAGSFAVLNPVMSVLLGVLILDEPVTARIFFGVVVTLLSVLWVQRVRTE